MNFIAAVEILEAVVYGTVKKDTPCVTEYTDVLQCMSIKNNDACLSCILDSVAGLGGNMTWPSLIESNICNELALCASETCDPRCPGLGHAASAKCFDSLRGVEKNVCV
jgi:hypothetical protein